MGLEIINNDQGRPEAAEVIAMPGVETSLGSVAVESVRALGATIKNERERTMGTWGVSGEVGPFVRALQVKRVPTNLEPLPPKAA